MKYVPLILFSGVISHASFAENHHEIDKFMMDYPHGGNRISVTRSGQATLFYGSSPKIKILKKGVFVAKDLYYTFKPYLHENLLNDKGLKPVTVYGMVKLIQQDGSESNYFIYDLKELTDGVFAKANENVVDESF